ncbi:MAG TPA: RNA 2',3'-cyclic phosphodiesterase [Candidatus Polarisedimenticolia bacterium]|nr:RNA 2',3'-cyclic phosphodiesterase [Candidatus Polarisedimenticolia bacterium]
MRLFVAAEIPEDVRERLAACQKRLRDLPLPLRWTRPEGIHLTFFFLGETPEARVAAIAAVLEPVAAATARVRLEAHGVHTFPGHGRPRVIVFGLRGDLEAAARLKSGLDGALRTLGFTPDDRPFHPHLTLARAKEGHAGDWKTPLARESEAEGGRFEVRRLVLFESRLGPGGSQYRAMREFPLADESRTA